MCDAWVVCWSALNGTSKNREETERRGEREEQSPRKRNTGVTAEADGGRLVTDKSPEIHDGIAYHLKP